VALNGILDLLEELDTRGTFSPDNTQGPSIDEPLSEVQVDHKLYQLISSGSTTSLSNSAGNLANTYTYDSFGKLTVSTRTLVNPFQFAGRAKFPRHQSPEIHFALYEATGRRTLTTYGDLELGLMRTLGYNAPDYGSQSTTRAAGGGAKNNSPSCGPGDD